MLANDAEAQFVVVAALDRLPDGAFLRVMIDAHGLVIARNGAAIYAFQGTCPHEQADLAQGRIEDGRLICPRHLASYSLADGEVSRGWKVNALKLYPVRVEGNEIAVDAGAVRRHPPGGGRKLWDLTRK
jgi:3-phenylpropionate/trans-cinnamate dioxygenase ferredoxin component